MKQLETKKVHVLAANTYPWPLNWIGNHIRLDNGPNVEHNLIYVRCASIFVKSDFRRKKFQEIFSEFGSI